MKVIRLIPITLYVIALCFGFYNLGLTQASLNVYDYDDIDTSIELACTAMIDKKPVEEVQGYIDSYNLIRDVDKLQKRDK